MAQVTAPTTTQSLPPPPEGKQFNSKIREGDADTIAKCQELATDIQRDYTAWKQLNDRIQNPFRILWQSLAWFASAFKPTPLLGDPTTQQPQDPMMADFSDALRRWESWNNACVAYESECLEPKVAQEPVVVAERSSIALFARDAGNMAEQFSDAVVATAVYDAKYAGEVVGKVAVPLVILGAAAFGVARMVETGDTSTVQRAFAMMR